jgi:hypothetical protein
MESMSINEIARVIQHGSYARLPAEFTMSFDLQEIHHIQALQQRLEFIQEALKHAPVPYAVEVHDNFATQIITFHFRVTDRRRHAEMILRAAGHDPDHLAAPSDLYNPTLGRPFEDDQAPRRYRSAPQERASPFRAFANAGASASDAADALAAMIEAARPRRPPLPSRSWSSLAEEYLRNETPPIVIAPPAPAAAPTPPPPPVVQIHALRHQRKLQLPTPPASS